MPEKLVIFKLHLPSTLDPALVLKQQILLLQKKKDTLFPCIRGKRVGFKV
jgi:hypothetical protein